MILETAAWAATAAILLTYALTVRGGERHALRFHIANAIGCVPLAILNAQAGVWPALVVNLGFGVPAWVAVLREISRRRLWKRTYSVDEAREILGVQISDQGAVFPLDQFLAQADDAYAHSDEVWEALRDIPRVHDSVVYTRTPQEQCEQSRTPSVIVKGPFEDLVWVPEVRAADTPAATGPLGPPVVPCRGVCVQGKGIFCGECLGVTY